MCVVSIKEFNQNPAKFLQIAEKEPVVIEGEGQTFELVKKEVFISVDEAIDFLNEPVKVLYKDGYFGFKESALEYVNDI